MIKMAVPIDALKEIPKDTFVIELTVESPALPCIIDPTKTKIPAITVATL